MKNETTGKDVDERRIRCESEKENIEKVQVIVLI